MFVAEIITPWTGTGAEGDPNRPLVGDAFQLASWSDVVGQDGALLQPDPNLYVVRAELEGAVLDAIEADAAYFVLTSEEIIDEATE